MANSPLTTYTKVAKYYQNRYTAIDTITIHCYVGQVTAEEGCNYFANIDRVASANYVVGYDGSIGSSVPESYASYCSSNWSNDGRAVTIEVACERTHPYEVTDEAFEALVKLCADICIRNHIPKLLWRADPSLVGQVDLQNMTVHRWFDAKACPGEHLYNRHYEIAYRVNQILLADDVSNPAQIWNYFMAKIGNEYGVAGLMGNLEAESGLHPDRVQGDIPYSSYSVEYTNQVNQGFISEYDFVHNGPGGGGYGLAQWTFYSRKQALYDRWKSGNYTSIGSMALACDYLWYELQNDFHGVLSVLKTATSVRMASDKVLHDFENPADQSSAVEVKRASMGQAWYDKYSGMAPGGGTTPTPPSGGEEFNPLKRKQMSLLLMSMATRRR